MNKFIKFVLATTSIGLFVFCEMTNAMRESPYAKSMSDIQCKGRSVTLNDEWISFNSVCNFGKVEEIVQEGTVFATDALTALEENRTIDKATSHRIVFLCNSKMSDLLDMFTEEFIEGNSGLKTLLIKLSKVSNR